MSANFKKWIVDVGAFHGDEGRRIKHSLTRESDYPLLFIEADTLNYLEIETLAGEKKLNLAISSHDGFVDFHRYKPETGSVLPLDLVALDQYVDGHTGIRARAEDWRLREKVRVPSRRLDTLFAEHGISHVRFLKIDTQGYDFEVIKSLGDKIAIVDELVCEVQLLGAQIYKNSAPKEDILGYLNSKGFLFIRQKYQSYGQELNMYFKRKDLLGGVDKEPLVSVLTPCYNSGRYLERCIQSVIDQEYPHFEHIIQDGASTDETLQILEKYKDRISWVSEKDQGQSDGLNRALQRCKGDIIGVLNADDEYEPGALLWAFENLSKNPGAGVIYGEQNNINEEGQVLFQSRGPEPYSFEKIFCCEEVIPAQAAFIRRATMDKAGYYIDVTRKTCPDYEMWVRLGAVTSMKAVSGFVSRYRIHSGSEGQQADVIEKMVASKLEVIERFTQSPLATKATKKLAARARAGVYEWSAWHFLPPHTIKNQGRAVQQTFRAFWAYPHPRYFWQLFRRACVYCRLPDPDVVQWLKIIFGWLRFLLRRIDMLLLGGMIYNKIYLPSKTGKVKNAQTEEVR